jgi:hypothetical protein
MFSIFLILQVSWHLAEQGAEPHDATCRARMESSAVQAVFYNFFCTYVSSKQIRVDLPAAGISYRVCQVIALLAYFALFGSTVGLFASITVQGAAEAYAVGSLEYDDETPYYCDNEDLGYVYSDAFKYISPKCVKLKVFEVNQKKTNYLSFSTVFIETHVLSWPCAGGGQFETDADALCNTAEYQSEDGLQCYCEYRTSKFPREIEKAEIEITSVYDVEDYADWSGRSSSETGPDGTSLTA